MKIAIASDDEITIASHVGRTKGFVIADLENGKINDRKYIENDFTGHKRGLKGHEDQSEKHGPILTALKDCQAIISHGMGRRLFQDLNIAGIETYITEEKYVARAINLFVDGLLDNNPELCCEHD